ncbi:MULTISPECIES: PEP-CTERM sorting domain-containing protein [Vibrio]|uniref:PEP-CTERM sorting domain-containing protein n=2 Tax=Vibrio TaxID=662 RepID=A0A7X4LP48_9VIBR|nr:MULTISPECIES: PEP-CTERM sorting domain-containing protein [Vibrio]MBF9002131.1 PEP-CTERM sorting domain-containing protein [Vibrio nitrifigilis]MZI95534.1 PEP-CTERM sorting domain-containing protein [Vibrio eleionomae]
MAILSKMIKGFLLCFALASASQAYAGSFSLAGLDWAVDIDGNGDTSDGLVDIDTLDFAGYTLVSVSDTDFSGTLTDNDTFTDYNYLTADDLAGIYTLNTMTGTLDNTVTFGSLTYSTAYFDGSTMSWYDASDTSILTISVTSGSSLLLLDGTDLTIGQISLTLSIDSVVADYFYVDVNGTWVDLADLVASKPYDAYYFSVLTYAGVPDAILAAYEAELNAYTTVDTSTYLTDYAGIATVDLTDAFTGSGYTFVVVNDGTVDLTRRVPEPGMLTLMGLAFIGLAGLQRRRKFQLKLTHC